MFSDHPIYCKYNIFSECYIYVYITILFTVINLSGVHSSFLIISRDYCYYCYLSSVLFLKKKNLPLCNKCNYSTLFSIFTSFRIGFGIWTPWCVWRRVVPEVAVVAATDAVRNRLHPLRRRAADRPMAERNRVTRAPIITLFECEVLNIGVLRATNDSSSKSLHARGRQTERETR